MLIHTNEYIHRVNGIPLYYNGLAPFLHHPSATYFDYHVLSTPNASPPYTNYDPLMSKAASQNSLPLTLTPPISPLPLSEGQTRRESVIMKVKNCQIFPAKDANHDQHICRWEHCFRIFETLEALANHVSIAHSSVGYNNFYYCKWEGCQRSERGFNARYKMLVHCRTHTKEKPHICTYAGCTKAFSRAENLKIHFRSHTLEKPYRCSFPGCIKAYSNSSDRFKHSRTHQNNKPYMCKVPGCSKRYTDPSSLRKHVKTFIHPDVNQSRDVSMDCEMTSNHSLSDKIYSPGSDYYNSISLNEHLKSREQSCWEAQREEIADRIESIKLDQPLDLSFRQDR